MKEKIDDTKLDKVAGGQMPAGFERGNYFIGSFYLVKISEVAAIKVTVIDYDHIDEEGELYYKVEVRITLYDKEVVSTGYDVLSEYQLNAKQVSSRA